MTSIDFLDAVRDRHGIPSDRKLSKFLGLPQGWVSLYRTGNRTLTPSTCHLVAEALDMDPGYVMASIQAERAKRSEDRRVWERVANLVKSAAAALVVALGLVGFSGERLEAATAEGTDNIHYTHKGRRRSWLRRALNWSNRTVEAAIYPLCVLACLAALSGLAGCAATPQEKAWQAMHLIDVAQTITGPARDPNFIETGSARIVIGDTPSVETVVAWGVVLGVAHYALDRWLTKTDRADQPLWQVLRAVDLGYKGFVIGHNHACGIRVAGDNKLPRC